MYELARLVLLATVVLVCVIAFAAAIKPMSDGKLGAGDAIRFIGLIIPPMLAYALPFAAGLASTLVYHRLATDNEITAAQAGGISLRMLLVPAIVTGLFLSGMLAILNEQLIPRFLQQATRMVTVNVPRYLAMQIPKGTGVELTPGLHVIADAAHHSYDAEYGVDHVMLARMMAVKTDGSGKIVQEVAAPRADLWFYPPSAGDGQGEGTELAPVFIRMSNAMVIDKSVNNAYVKDRVEGTYQIPSPTKTDPKFLTFGELRELRDMPERMNWVDRKRRELALALGQSAAIKEIATALTRVGQVRLIDDRDQDVIVRGKGLSPKPNAGPGQYVITPTAEGGVEVELNRVGSEGTTATRLAMTAKEATLIADLSFDPATRRSPIRLSLERVRTRVVGASPSPADDTATDRSQLIVDHLTLPSKPADAILKLSARDLVARAKTGSDANEALVQVQADALSKDIADLMRLITSKQHERWAMAVSCAVMVLTGAVTALKMSKRMPLTVYLWTFVPAIVSLVTISGGQQMVRQAGTNGLVLMWAGVGGLTLYTLLVYRSLARH